MKKAMIAVALLGLMGNAYALDASQVFTWSGNVPAAPKVSGWVIAQPNGDPIPRGILVFNTDNTGKGVLAGSTELRFKVFKEDTNPVNKGKPDLNEDAAHTYKYTLTSLVVNNSGLAAEQADDDYFAIQALNGGVVTLLTKNIAVDALEEETILSVVKSASIMAGNQPEANDSVDVQATVVVDGSDNI